MTQLHSEYLRTTHQAIYQDFFSLSETIVSSPFVMQRRPRPSADSLSIHIRKKIPTRMYMGVSKVPWKASVTLWDISLYDMQSEQFVSSKKEDSIGVDILQRLEESMIRIMEEFDIHEDRKIHILSEQKRWYGFGFVGMVCVLFASLVISHQEKTTTTIDDTLRKKIYDLAMEIDTERWGNPSWLLPRVTLEEWYDSWIQLWSKEMNSSTPQERQFTFSQLTGYSSCMDRFDHGMISFWSPYHTLDLKKRFKQHEHEENELGQYIEDILADTGLSYDLHLKDYKYKNYKKFLGYIKVIKHLESVCKDPYNENLHTNVINAFWSIWVLESIEKFHNTSLTVLYTLFDALKAWDSEKIWIVPICLAGGGWTFFFVALKDKSRETIASMKEALHEKWYTNAYSPFLSWRDWNIYEWLQIEQNISWWFFSEYISKTSVFVEKDWEKNISQHDIAIVEENENLVLDTIHKKIFYKGEKLTYKHLRSQSATVEILQVLIERYWELIHNSEFPASSYSKNKNEMIGKVIES